MAIARESTVSKDHQRQDLENAFIECRVRLREVAQRIVGTRDLAEDVLQTAYLRIVHPPSRPVIQQPISYCFQVVRHLAIDCRRRSMLESQLFTPEATGHAVPSPRSHPEQAVISQQYLRVIENALAELPKRTRQAFRLYRVDGMTQREIATRLGVSPTLVNFMIRDAVEALKSCREQFIRD